MAKPNYAFEKRQKELAKKKKKEEKRLRKAEEGHIEEEGGTILADGDTQPATDSST
jgi:hypothetical protein